MELDNIVIKINKYKDEDEKREMYDDELVVEIVINDKATCKHIISLVDIDLVSAFGQVIEMIDEFSKEEIPELN